jgi:nucleotide-binding universal stress UspA family protein
MNILLVYDGTLHAKKALRYGIEKLREASGELTILQVFDPSLFIDYDAGPQAEAMARREASQGLAEARQIVKEQAAGLAVRIISDEGDAIRKVMAYVEEERPGLVLAPPRYKELATTLTCPFTLIPGTILVPVDNTGGPAAGTDRIVSEATATGSRVLLLGVVPVHLYSREEKNELERVKKEITGAVKKMKRTLLEKGLAVSEAVRFGYPDEEILKAADEHAVSLILLPAGSAAPSELSKAAAILACVSSASGGSGLARCSIRSLRAEDEAISL